MAAPDKVLKQTYDWFSESVDRALSSLSAAQRSQVEPLIWQMVGVQPFPIPANPDLNDCRDTGAAAESLAVAAQVVAETLVGLEYVKRAVFRSALMGGHRRRRYRGRLGLRRDLLSGT